MGITMDSMVSTVPSAWLTMENALARLARDFTILTILTLVLVVVSLLSWFRTGVLDLGFVLAIAVLIALRDFDSFCRSDGADTSVEPDGLTAEPVRRRPRAPRLNLRNTDDRDESVVEVEFVLLRDRIPVFVSFLEDRVEECADDLAELLNLRPEARQLLHHFLVGSGHSKPLTRAITG